MKTVLVTGVNGFVGKHLVRELHQRGQQIHGIGHTEAQADPEVAPLLSTYLQCDLSNNDDVATLDLQGMDSVINLAGLANVGASFDNPELYLSVNVKVLSVLGAALLQANPKARMIAVSTGALYDPNQPMPLSEEARTIEKGSPYTQSKLAMESAAQDLRHQGQDCIVVRPFNHIGPGQGLGFLIPDLAAKLQTVDKQHLHITAGNLKTVRDYTDVRDIVKAYADLVEAPLLNHDLYNVCSGKGQTGEDIVRALCETYEVNFEELTIDVDQSLIRPTDPAKIIGDSSRLQQDTGWKPTISLAQTVHDIVDSLK